MRLALVCPVHVFLREQHNVGPTQCLLAWVWEGGRKEGRKRGGRERSRLTEQLPSLTRQTRQLTEVRGLAGARGGQGSTGSWPRSAVGRSLRGRWESSPGW